MCGENNKIIGSYTGKEKGPLVIVFGGMHGNEPAGICALELIFKMIEVEPITNPKFTFKGRIVGIIGNLAAYKQKKRYIDEDLNRIWSKTKIQRIKNLSIDRRSYEENELLKNIEIVKKEIKQYKPKNLVVLDLHTTSSNGGIFTIVSDEEKNLHIALELHAPVIKGMLDGIQGTALHYFNDEQMGIPTQALSFESGQHEDALSVNRAIAAITNCLRTVGCVKEEHVENRHDSLLIEYSRELPKVSRLIARHEIQNGDGFSMLPNYSNFQKVNKGELLASDVNGNIKAVTDALILMPLYQNQGDDGFFLIKEVEGF